MEIVIIVIGFEAEIIIMGASCRNVNKVIENDVLYTASTKLFNNTVSINNE